MLRGVVVAAALLPLLGGCAAPTTQMANGHGQMRRIRLWRDRYDWGARDPSSLHVPLSEARLPRGVRSAGAGDRSDINRSSEAEVGRRACRRCVGLSCRWCCCRKHGYHQVPAAAPSAASPSQPAQSNCNLCRSNRLSTAAAEETALAASIVNVLFSSSADFAPRARAAVSAGDTCF
jgi:hypothetical protein